MIDKQYLISEEQLDGLRKNCDKCLERSIKIAGIGTPEICNFTEKRSMCPKLLYYNDALDEIKKFEVKAEGEK